jgi:hypothetical protein
VFYGRKVDKPKPKQLPIPVPMNQELQEALSEEALREMGYSNRSKFIRDAVIEKINAYRREHHQPELPPGFGEAPSRLGKGGRPTHKSQQVSFAEDRAVEEDSKTVQGGGATCAPEPRGGRPARPPAGAPNPQPVSYLKSSKRKPHKPRS